MRIIPAASAALFLTSSLASAQAHVQPPTIPTVVAEAMTLEWSMFGRPQYYDGRTPDDWPAELTPAGARVIGGGSLGQKGMFFIQAGVFAFPAGSNPRAIMRETVARAGYRTKEEAQVDRPGGFLPTADTTQAPRYCKGITVASFGPIDSTRDPLVWAVTTLQGPSGPDACTLDPARTGPTPSPIKVPELLPPPGARAMGSGSTWSGGYVEIQSTVIASASGDSVLAHYRRQLVAAGWKAEGKPASVEGVAIQRFTTRQGDAKWAGALLVISSADHHEVKVTLTRTE